MSHLVQCAFCKRFNRDSDGAETTCEAFPNGILQDIISTRHNHNLPYPGDNGILFEPVEDWAREDWKVEDKK